MTDDEIRKALREGYKQSENIRRGPLVVATVLAIVFSGFAYLIATVRW